MASPKPKTKPQSPLLATTTNEPFQPVRIYFAVPDADALMAKLQTLACMNVDPTRNCLEWLFDQESASLRFPGTFEDVPPAMRPIVLGRLRFPRKTAMTLQANSISRAIEGARFFGAKLGPLAVALRVRLVNRCFAASEGDINELAKTLDHDVVVVDPREGEMVLERAFKSLKTREGMLQFFKESQIGEDVPLVEDLQLNPEEETPAFDTLATTLNLRAIRAWEHWQGHTDVTLGSLIRKATEPGKKQTRRA
jgi:hypothetical protein